MKFIVTACLVSEMLKPRPKPGTREFFERYEVVIPFGTYLTIERGLDSLSRIDSAKSLELRSQVESLIAGLQLLQGHDPAIARVMARILAHGSVRHTWVPNEKAKVPSYGHYPWVAAASIATGLPIAAIKTKDLLEVADHFQLPGLYDPTTGKWLRREARAPRSNETPPLTGGISTRQ
ncbi:hypothetical protein [Rhizobium sp. CNPSo 3490]|uniref:hypothetical protein n=1 Tax=Rhizobium sp. CNPSo 3490 TaxID=3021407 RepID=UPI002550BD40|nr:hypothetical protein [Rhizobium sp. CNPSo 3490]MDK4733944.1 hypothetical protein [Rhizobium sp. CNPSo 3490]